MAFHLEVGADGEQINSGAAVATAETRKAPVGRPPAGERAPERAHSSRLLEGDEAGQAVSVHPAQVHAEPGDEGREHAQVAVIHPLDGSEDEGVLDVNGCR